MSGFSVLLYVGATTLAAAIVTLCGFQITTIRMDRKRSQRPRTLEGPVPGRLSLSSIGLNTQSARSTPSSSGHHGQRPTTPAGIPTDNSQKAGLPTSDTSQLPPPTKETKLNSLQTIRARSAALQSDGHAGKPAEAKPLMPGYAPSNQRPGTRALPVQEQGSAAQRAATTSKQQEKVERTPSDACLAVDSTGPATIQKTPTSKRAKRASAQTGPIETAHPGSDHTPADVLADPGGLELLDTLQSSMVEGSPNQEDGILDIFAGLSEAEVGLHDLTDDLNDIDSGGLPTAAPKTAQKSRR